MKLLEDKLNLESITVMVQKEVAERLTAKAGDKEYGVISVAVALYGKARITRQVNRKMFYPVPNVDSAVVRIDKNKKVDVEFSKFIILGASQKQLPLKN